MKHKRLNNKSKLTSLFRKVRRNLFSSSFDIFISSLLITIISLILSKLLSWLLFNANWNVVTQNISLYLFGTFPTEELWRPSLWMLLILSIILITLFNPGNSIIRKLLSISWISILPVGLFLMAGGLGLAAIPTREWGGIALTLILTGCSASLALPLGIFLAIGRQSEMRVIKLLCRIYIDVMRSVPLIAVLFFGQLLIPLFLPIEVDVNRVIRAVLAFALFAASYIAEDIRGGIQSIPSAQKEAAKVLGLTQWQTLQLVVLPQALKTAIPALTNQIIGLLQNTSLMAILGLVELLGISRGLLANPEYIGRYLEVYAWLALVYWFLCTAIALLSRHLEKALDPLTAND